MNTSNWKEFLYKDLFEIKKGKRLTKADMIDGCIPYIGATDSYNGITAFISNDKWLHKPNTISVSYNGSIAEAFYQDVTFWATDDVNVLYPKFDLNRNRAIFLTTIINREKFRYNYGRKWNKKIMEETAIKLPSDAKGKPDWSWIDNYVVNHLVAKLSPVAELVWNNSFSANPLAKSKIPLNKDKWQWFRIGDVFEVKAGKYHYPSEYDNGETPYISATSVNNGIADRISIDAEFKGNVVTTEKVKCKAFFQPDDFCATSDVNIVSCEGRINKFTGLFLATIIDFNENYRWNYGRQCRVEDTKSIRLKLPAVDTGKKSKTGTPIYEPDWQFMENYIKSLPYSSCL
ncbi:MAG: restriction endonuclease subunit S [Fibrobacteraceae bacterium]|nr:restriction endonuclease subunit S [Fibrobacteraceae bacterium]